MKKIFIVLFLVLISNFLGCGVARMSEASTNNKLMMKLSVGMSHDTVLSIMGMPNKREVYGDVEYLFYVTEYPAHSSNDEFTPLFLKNGVLMGWGRNYYDDVKKYRIDSDIKISK